MDRTCVAMQFLVIPVVTSSSDFGNQSRRSSLFQTRASIVHHQPGLNNTACGVLSSSGDLQLRVERAWPCMVLLVESVCE